MTSRLAPRIGRRNGRRRPGETEPSHDYAEGFTCHLVALNP